MIIRSAEDIISELKHVDLNPFITGSSRRNSSDNSDDFLGGLDTRTQYSPPKPTFDALTPPHVATSFHPKFQKEGLPRSSLFNLHSLHMDAFQAVAPPPPHVDLDAAETAKSSPLATRFDSSPPGKGSSSSPSSSDGPSSPSSGLRFREKGEQTPTTPIRPSGRSGHSSSSGSSSSNGNNSSSSSIPVTSPVGRGRGPTPRPRPQAKEKKKTRSPSSSSTSVDPELDLPPKESPTNTPLSPPPTATPALTSWSSGHKRNASPTSSLHAMPAATTTSTTAAPPPLNLGNHSRGRGRFHSPKAFSEVHSSGYGKVSPRVSHPNNEPGSPNSPSSSSSSSSSSAASAKKRSSSAGTKPQRPWAKTTGGANGGSPAGGGQQHQFNARPSPTPLGSSAGGPSSSRSSGGVASSSRSGSRSGNGGSSNSGTRVDHCAALRSPTERQGGTWPAERSDSASAFGNAYRYSSTSTLCFGR